MAQQVQRVPCMEVMDGDGDSPGPVVETGPGIDPVLGGVPNDRDRAFSRLPRVAMAAPSGEIFLVSVSTERLVGRLPPMSLPLFSMARSASS